MSTPLPSIIEARRPGAVLSLMTLGGAVVSGAAEVLSVLTGAYPPQFLFLSLATLIAVFIALVLGAFVGLVLAGFALAVRVIGRRTRRWAASASIIGLITAILVTLVYAYSVGYGQRHNLPGFLFSALVGVIAAVGTIYTVFLPSRSRKTRPKDSR